MIHNKPRKDASRKPVVHQCGGTLINLGDEYEGKSNVVVTAAHCFCSLTWNGPKDPKVWVENLEVLQNI